MKRETQVAFDARGDSVRVPLHAGPFESAAAARQPDVTLSLHDDLSTAERDWCDFEQRADCTVFQTFGWLSRWQLCIGTRRGVRPAIVIGRNARREMLFLLPLAVEPRGFARKLVWLGSDVNDYNAPLLSPDPSQAAGDTCLSLWPEILARIQSRRELRFDLVHLVRMPEGVGNQPNPFRLVPVTLHPSGIYLTHLAGDWATFYAAKRSRSTRQRDRTKLNRLKEIGEVKFVTPSAAGEIAQSFRTLMAQKSRSFAAMGVRNIFERPGYPEFYGALAIDPATRRIAHLSRLDVGEVPAAINLGLTFRDRYYHVLASYDHGEVSRFGAGAVHLHELMRHAIETGCRVFDFTVGDERYKRDWSDTESVLFDHVSIARWRGALVAPPLLAATRLKRFIKQTPAVWHAFGKARAFLGTLRGRLARLPGPGEPS